MRKFKNSKMPRCEIDMMIKCIKLDKIKIPQWQIVETADYGNAKMQILQRGNCVNAKIRKCDNSINRKRQNAMLPQCDNARMPKSQNAKIRQCHNTKMPKSENATVQQYENAHCENLTMPERRK